MKDFRLFKNCTNAYYEPGTVQNGTDITVNTTEQTAPALTDLTCPVRKRDTNK